MLIVFAFSVTPTILLHDFFVNHTDTVKKKSSDSDREQVGKKLYNCHCDNIVAESPFTDTEIIVFLSPKQVLSSPETDDVTNISSYKIVSRSLRGPPAV